MEIGQRIATLRRKRGLSQIALARRVRCHPSLISRIESGTVALTLPRLIKIADALGVRPEDLLSDRAVLDEGRESA